MADITFAQIMQAARKLNSQQKVLLVQSLDLPLQDEEPTRESLITELHERRVSGAFDHVKSLRNRYADLTLDDLTDEQLSADIHEVATEWEKELDEFFGDDH